MVAKKVAIKKKETIVGPIPPIAIPLEWHVPDGQITPFATNMVVQIMEGAFKISFFEVKPQILFDESTPPPTKVRADCVASVVVAPNKIPKIIEVLQGQYEQYMSTK